MGKAEEISTTEKLVKKILERDPLARNSDDYLYIRVMKEINPDACKMPFINVWANKKNLGLPPVGTVGRCRRKLQQEYPELWSDKQIQRYREEARKDFEDYARS